MMQPREQETLLPGLCFDSEEMKGSPGGNARAAKSPGRGTVSAAPAFQVPKKRRTVSAAARNPAKSAASAAGTVCRVRRIPAEPK